MRMQLPLTPPLDAVGAVLWDILKTNPSDVFVCLTTQHTDVVLEYSNVNDVFYCLNRGRVSIMQADSCRICLRLVALVCRGMAPLCINITIRNGVMPIAIAKLFMTGRHDKPDVCVDFPDYYGMCLRSFGDTSRRYILVISEHWCLLNGFDIDWSLLPDTECNCWVGCQPHVSLSSSPSRLDRSGMQRLIEKDCPFIDFILDNNNVIPVT